MMLILHRGKTTFHRMSIQTEISHKTKILSTVHNLLDCVVLLFQNRSVANGTLSKQLEVRQKDVVKLMVHLIPINFSDSKIRAQNIDQKLGQGSTPSPPPL